MSSNSRKEKSRYIDLGERGKYDTKNSLNDLTGKEWIQFTKSWEIYQPKPRKGDELHHPAKFPETLVEAFVSFFTKKDAIVLDPFLGTGTTVRVCQKLGRSCIGIELIPKYYKIAKKSLSQQLLPQQFGQRSCFYEVIKADSRNILNIWEEKAFKKINYCITSPPYWNMLKKSRGGVQSVSKERKAKGLDQYYSEDNPNDLGNIKSYSEFLNTISKIFNDISEIMQDSAYLTIVVQNILDENGVMIPLAWDLAKKLSNKYILLQEKLWLQNDTKFGIWGYPHKYISNVAHHYCLNFKKK
ncbi:MAG: DNA methyltransferase [Candidatus Heimdallarchaeaceae archaeon]